MQYLVHMLRLVHIDRARQITRSLCVRRRPDLSERTADTRLAGRASGCGGGAARVRTDGVPWHRIVRADGSLAKGDRQRALLEAEGVPFRGRRVDMRIARLPDLARLADA